MSGADGSFYVKVFNHNGEQVDVVEDATFWSWDDDDENKLRIECSIWKPEGF